MDVSKSKWIWGRLLDFYEDIINSNEYVANKWIIDETVSVQACAR